MTQRKSKSSAMEALKKLQGSVIGTQKKSTQASLAKQKPAKSKSSPAKKPAAKAKATSKVKASPAPAKAKAPAAKPTPKPKATVKNALKPATKSPAKKVAVKPSPSAKKEARPAAPKATTKPLAKNETSKKSVSESNASLKLPRHLQERLTMQVKNTSWTQEILISQLIEDHLHTAYSGIECAGVMLSSEGFFRSFESTPGDPKLTLKSDRGTFRITVRESNSDYVRWVYKLISRKESTPEVKAAEQCLFNLQQSLEVYLGMGGTHTIDTANFKVEQVN